MESYSQLSEQYRCGWGVCIVNNNNNMASDSLMAFVLQPSPKGRYEIFCHVNVEKSDSNFGYTTESLSTFILT